jgi:hypothetical protein
VGVLLRPLSLAERRRVHRQHRYRLHFGNWNPISGKFPSD